MISYKEWKKWEENKIFVIFRHVHHFFEIKITKLITPKPIWVGIRFENGYLT
jgi:hypothetical protein